MIEDTMVEETGQEPAQPIKDTLQMKESEDVDGEGSASKGITVEELASEMGWKPKDKFTGNETDYVGPDEYIRRSKDIQKAMRQDMKESQKKLSKMDATIRSLKAHYDSVSQAQAAEYQRKVDELKQARIAAIEEGDVAKVEKIEGDIATMSEYAASTPKTPDSTEQDYSELRAVFAGWHKDNPWYSYGDQDGNEEMTQYANYLSQLPEYKGLPYEKRLQTVGAKVRSMFGQTDTSARGKAQINNPVEGARPAMSDRRTFTERDLTRDQREAMNSFVKLGVMTKEEYIADLAKMGELR